MLWRKTTASLLLLTLISLLLAPHSLETLASAESDRRGDAAHFPAFFLLTLLIFSLLPQKCSLNLRLSLCGFITLALAISTEWIQGFTPGRMASTHDLIANLLGVGFAISAIWVWQDSRTAAPLWQKIIHLTLTLIVAGLLAQPYFQHLNARLSSQKKFPLLSDFHNPQFAMLWKTQNGSKANLSQSSTRPRLKVTFPEKNTFTGINYLPGSQDWSHYSTLHLTLHNSGPPFPLGIRIDDNGNCSQSNSRFNDERLLKFGENHIIFELENIRQSPQDRELDLTSIRRLLLFTQKNPNTHKFSIIRMWLGK